MLTQKTHDAISEAVALIAGLGDRRNALSILKRLDDDTARATERASDAEAMRAVYRARASVAVIRGVENQRGR